MPEMAYLEKYFSWVNSDKFTRVSQLVKFINFDNF